MGQINASRRDWMPIGPADLREARLQIHWAAQIVSALGRSFVTPRADDSHPNLGYVAEGGLLMGRATETVPSFHAAIAIPTSTILLMDQGIRVIDQLEIDGVTLEDAFVWLERAVDRHSGGACKGPIDRTLYDLPEHPVSAGAPFSKPAAGDLSELRAWYHNADLVLRTFVSGREGASDVRVWPHHFDLGTLVVLDRNADPATARSVGLGMTPGDDSYAEPYFYVNPYPRPTTDRLPPLLGGGIWRQQDWFGAVLTASSLVSASPEQQHETVMSYLSSSFEAANTLLER